jgi:hypothetical protein
LSRTQQITGVMGMTQTVLQAVSCTTMRMPRAALKTIL